MARRSAGMGERHQKIMDFLIKFQNENGYPPSIREVGESINVKSTSLVDYYLDQLEQMEYIERDKRVSRSIRILRGMGGQKYDLRRAIQDMTELLRVPVCGRIIAGEPIPVPASDSPYFDEYSSVEVARSLFSSKENVASLFALEVQGNSMIDAMINEGDIVIMRPAQDASNGDMVAVWWDDQTTLKYFYREKNRIRLQPANPTMDPIYVDNPENFEIKGKVVAVIRQFKTA